ncbi:Formin BNI1 [Spathaspora sp. JA1]|nr:Formin BNI1 [Spathaspora sp. JA1]
MSTPIISRPSKTANELTLPQSTGFVLERPDSIYEIDRMFKELMEKRDFKSLPPQAKQEMVNYTPDKKWMLIYQDRYAEYTRQERSARSSRSGQTKSSDSPEYYTTQLLSRTITAEELEKLWVALRTEPLDWVRKFIYDCQGDACLSAYLIKVQDEINQTEVNDINNEKFDREFNTLKALKCMMNQKLGAERVRTDANLYVNAISGSLLSPRIITRKMAADSLTFMISYYSSNVDGGKYHKILHALDSVSQKPHFEFEVYGNDQRQTTTSGKLVRKPPAPEKYKRFELWLRLVERTVDGKGKYMDSLVGASDELKSAHAGASGTITASSLENHLVEYCLGTMLLINTIVEHGDDYRIRIRLRAQFNAAGLDRLLYKFQELGYDSLNQQCYKFIQMAQLDEDELKVSEQIDEDLDFNNPVDLISSLWDNVKNSEAQGYFLSAIQHLYLNQSEKRDDAVELGRSLRLLDGLIQNIAMVHTTNDDTAVGIAINRLFANMSTDDMYKKALEEAKNFKRIAEEATAERDDMSRQLSIGTEGVITNLSNELKEQEIVLLRTRRLADELTSELNELKIKHLQEKQEQELEMRELLIMLNNNDVDSEFETKREKEGKTTIALKTTNEELAKKLQKQIHRRRAEYRLDNRQFGGTTQVEPSKRLRALRDQMGDIENMARELEMTEFENYDNPYEEDGSEEQPETELESESESEEEEEIAEVEPEPPLPGPKRNVRGDDLAKLDKLRKKLASLQTESNDIMKYNNSSMFNRQKFLAMERLRDLENNFKDFNIDFSVNEEEENHHEHFEQVDPSIKNKIKEEWEEIARLKLELKHKLAANTKKKPTKANKDTIARIEEKYVKGKVKTSSNVDIVKATTPSENKRANRMTTIGVMNPAFLKELSTKVGRAEPIDGEEQEEQAFDDSVQGQSEDNQAAQLSAPVPVSVISVKSPADTKETSGLASPPPPPPPPLPDMLKSPGELSTPVTSPPPPPPAPPLPELLSGKTSPVPPPPAPPPPGFLNGNGEIPPAPPLPSPHQRMPISEPVTARTSSLFDNIPRPKKKLKQLHWEKLDQGQAKNSFWKDPNTETLASDLMERGVFDEIELIFAAKEIKKLATKKKDESEKISFMARDIAQQFSINLHAFSNLSDEELIMKMLRCDRDILHNPAVLEFFSKDEIVEVSNSLARNLEPYSTDYTVDEVSKPDKDPNELQRPDRIYLELIYNLQHYWKSRMRALTVITNYERDYEDLVTKLRLIGEAVDGIKQSKHLKQVFEVILTVGNYMNDSSKQAHGFKLSSLQRLSFMKDDKNSMTFLHYVEKIIRTQYPELLEFMDELSSCIEVAKFSIENIKSDCHEYNQAMKNVQSSIDVGNLCDLSKFHPQDRILKVILPVLPRGKRKGELLIDQSNYTMKEFDDLMIYFGEDPSDQFVKNSFMSKFANFIKDFKRVQTDNLKREEEIRIYEQRKKMLETTGKKSSEAGDDDEGDDKDVMDSLLEKLKATGPPRGEPMTARRRALRKQMLEDQTKPVAREDDTEDSTSRKTSPTREKDGELEPKDVEPGARAKNLLQELRGGNEESSGEKVSAAQRFRQERLRKKLTSSIGDLELDKTPSNE